ncbi:hypothetical protein WA026_012373 [Henosepilachna vigintioctopunctata]|uniref:Uncharacterized protein n=1 Tax=Henosepilachna vigintioctopunctata TaxID=420089 RepID=A0AAW1UXI9_9CUCU
MKNAYDTEDTREENPITVKRQRKPPAWHKDYMVGNDNGIEGSNIKEDESYFAFALNAEAYVENNLPETIEDIQNRIYKEECNTAVMDELDALKRNQTCTLVDFPKGTEGYFFQVVIHNQEGP